MATAAKEVESSVRRISEDKHLRSFLSVHFNSSEYVADIIRQGKSEEIFAEISKSMEDVKEEIQLYITQNKGHLMGGMQGVAALAERYSMLSITSQKLHRSVEKLKREALASHELISSRTRELERIHHAGTLLRQLRQFAHAYGQLEHLLAALKGNKKTLSGDKATGMSSSGGGGKNDSLALDASIDIRQMSTVAKLVNELEGLIAVQHLHDVGYLRERKDIVIKFGRDLRQLAQERLLQALKESDQASAASCLQIFFSLESLPKTLLAAIDTVISETVDTSRTLIDVDDLSLNFPDQLGGGSSGRGAKGAGSRTAAALAVVASMGTKGGTGGAQKKTVGADGKGGKGDSRAQSEVLLRAALKETATIWAEQVRELARRVHVLQRVVGKKEDPASHKRFTTHIASLVASGACDELSRSHRELRLLATGDLLSLFFARLQSSFGEMVLEKAKRAPSTVIRLYPYLRSAATEAVNAEYLSLPLSTSSSAATSSSSFSSSTGGSDDLSGVGRSSHSASASASPFGALDIGAGGEQYFSVRSVLGRGQARSLSKRGDVPGIIDPSSADNTTGAGASAGDGEAALVAALAPMKDKYLAACLSKMTAPVSQMFPELEGYTAAVPSKRDVQELLKAVSAELVNAAVDGGLSLLKVVCCECVKAMQLIVSKVRLMAISASADASLLELTVVDAGGSKSSVRPVPVGSTRDSQDSKGASLSRSGNGSGSTTNSFLRNNAQEHNLQLISLLAQLRDSLAALPSSVATTANSSSGSGSGSGDDTDRRTNAIQSEIMTAVVKPAHAAIDGLVMSALVAPTVLMVASYTKSVLFRLPAEGSSGVKINSRAGDVDEALLQGCSQAVSRAIAELPALLSTYFGSLPRAGTVGGSGSTPQKREEQWRFPATVWATEQLCLHIMSSYVSAAALVRPINEAWRLRTAKELSALEHAMSTYSGLNINSDLNHGDVDACPVYQEFRAFRRFIFREEESAVSASMLSPAGKEKAATTNDASATSPGTKIGMTAPSLEEMLALPYFKHLRPSTVLAYISSCSPSQMPSPYEGDNDAKTGTNVHAYLMQLTSLDETQEAQQKQSGSLEANIASVRLLYKSGHLVKDRRGMLMVATTWKVIPQETASWLSFQSSLDKFLQRISVAEPAKRVGMRSWADSVMSIGNYFFGGR